MFKMRLTITVYDNEENEVWTSKAYSIPKMWSNVKLLFKSFPEHRIVVTDDFDKNIIIKDLTLQNKKNGKTWMVDADPKTHDLTKERIHEIDRNTRKQLEINKFFSWVNDGIRHMN